VEDVNQLLVAEFSPSPSPPVWTDQQYQTIRANYLGLANNARNESSLVALFTPKLSELSAEAGLVFVNSEEFKWIRTLFEHPPNFLKSVGLSSAQNIYNSKPKPVNVILDGIRNEYCGGVGNYRFGAGIWEIRDMYPVIWEFKVRLTPEDRGKAYNYLLHLSRNDHVNTYCCILCSLDEFFIIQARNYTILNTRHGNWTTPGSRDAIVRDLNWRNNWHALLERLCEALSVRVVSFLGSGAHGRCFTVNSLDGGDQFVLKAALTISNSMTDSLTSGEFWKLSELLREVPHVVRVQENSFRRIHRGNDLLGVGYLMTTVGEPLTVTNCRNSQQLVTLLLLSLREIHRHGFHHGDARFNNAILVENVPCWVDFFAGPSHVGTTTQDCRRDIEMLFQSIFGERVAMIAMREPPLSHFLAQYDEQVGFPAVCLTGIVEYIFHNNLNLNLNL